VIFRYLFGFLRNFLSCLFWSLEREKLRLLIRNRSLEIRTIVLFLETPISEKRVLNVPLILKELSILFILLLYLLLKLYDL